MLFFQLPASKENAQQNPAQTALVQNQFRKYAPILEILQFYAMSGSADTPLKASSSTGGQLRALNAEYSDNKAELTTGEIALRIFGDKSQVDRAYERRNQDIVSIRLRELQAVAMKAALNGQYQIITGSSGDANSFDGLLNSVPTARKKTHSYAVNTEALVRDLVEVIKFGIDETPGANGIVMDSQLKSAISKYADKMLDSFTNELGHQVTTIDGVPIVIAGKNAAGTRALPWTPTSATSLTKVLIMRSGEADGVAAASNVGLEVRDQGLVGNFWTTSFEMDVDLEVLDDNAIYLIEGIKGAS